MTSAEIALVRGLKVGVVCQDRLCVNSDAFALRGNTGCNLDSIQR